MRTLVVVLAVVAVFMICTEPVFAFGAGPNTCVAIKAKASFGSATTTDYFSGISAANNLDAWAAGTDGANGAIMAHWNGLTWTATTVTGFFPSTVRDIASNDAWSVGIAPSSGTGAPFIFHYNGSMWSVFGFPGVTSTYDFMKSMSSTSANDIWTVGYAQSSSTMSSTLIEHWNGSTWSVVASPNVSSTQLNRLQSVAAISMTNAWAVGDSFNSTTNSSQPMVMRWNGKTWSLVTTPSFTNFSPFGVSAAGANDVWVAGSSSSGPIAVIWNGTTWTVRTIPAPSGSTLTGLVVAKATAVWVTGFAPNSHGVYVPFGDVFNGSTWTLVPGATGGAYGARFFAASAIPGTSAIWAAGTISTVLNQNNDNLTFVNKFHC